MIRQRFRIRFAKQDDLRWISHRDLMRVWERLFRRAGIELSMTEGFHPKPRISFPSALAVGIAGLQEVLEVDAARDYSPLELQGAIAPHAPPGLTVLSVEAVPAETKKAQVRSVVFAAPVEPAHADAVRERIAALLASASFPVVREGRAAPLDLRPLIESLSLTDDTLRARLRVEPDGSARPRELLSALGLDELEAQGALLTRTEVELHA